MEVNTGIGYIKNEKGEIIAKYDLPKGVHPLLKEGWTHVELNSREELAAVIVKQPDKTAEQLAREKKRKSAIEKLKAIGLDDEEISALI